MLKEEKNNQFLAIKSMFANGNIYRMKDLEKLYPTGVSKALRMNHSRYIQKLYNPDGFTIKQISDFAKLLDVDIHLILDVIVKELSSTKSIRQKIV